MGRWSKTRILSVPSVKLIYLKPTRNPCQTSAETEKVTTEIGSAAINGCPSRSERHFVIFVSMNFTLGMIHFEKLIL